MRRTYVSRFLPHAWAEPVSGTMRCAFALAWGVPFALYLWTASGASYWLDGGEFVAAAVNLDIAHPPGHPLTALYGKAWTLLPLGSIAFRMALGQAFAAALAAAFAFRACVVTARGFDLIADGVVAPIALVGTWLFALGYAVWFQAVRPEVYALQAALMLFAMERLAVLHARAPTGSAKDARPLYSATFAIGLGLCNHHVMSVFMLPPLLASVFVVARRDRVRPWLVCTGLGLCALSMYVYLPIRALRQLPANFGDPRTLDRFLWVVSARIYARHSGDKNPESLGQRFGDLAAILAEHFYFVLLVVALLGLYVMLRREPTRRLGFVWLLCAATAFVVRPWLGAVRANPDAIAYMISGFAAISVLVCAALAVIVSFVPGGDARAPRWAPLLWLLPGLLLAAQIAHFAPQVDLAHFQGPDLLDDYRHRELPPRSVVVATTPQLVFRELELAATEAVRRDVTLIPVPFLRYPGVADAFQRKHPELRDLVGSYLKSDRIDSPALLRLAARRPVMVELDPHVPAATYAVLLPVGALYAAVGERAAQAALAASAALQQKVYRRIEADLGDGVHQVETAHQLLWLHYMDVLFYAVRGQHPLALAALDAATALDPEDTRLHALREALNNPASSVPLDVRPFLGFDSAPAGAHAAQ
jgi:hypothetical protein